MKTEFSPNRINAEARRTQSSAERQMNNFLRVSPRPLRLRVKLPLTAVFLCVLALMPSGLRAQTNNLTALLQQGLFEEQANRNLDAAIADYQALATQFDKDRQLAATAIFRLGECYRMQGKTNEAALEYKRIVNEFSDQTSLATLSRQNLTGMGMSPAQVASEGVVKERLLLARQIELAEQDLADAQRLSQIGVAPQDKARTAEREVLRLKQQLAALDAGKVDLPDLAASASSEEDKEIQRIQTMIQNSPDLINAPSVGANGNLTPLENAASHGWLKVAAYLLDHGADVNARGGTALFEATKAGNRAMVELLLSRGANVNANQADTEGNTPLHIAAINGFQAVTEALLANKADVNAQNRSGNTPLLLAAQRNNPKILSLLLEHRADVNVSDHSGTTPLMAAAGNKQPEVVKMLLAAKADPNAGKRDAPLLCAIHNRDVASAELLLQAGANPNAKGPVDFSIPNNSSGITPLYAAIYSDQLPMVQLLLKYKADPNDSKADGKPLIFAAVPHLDILAALLDAGADTNPSNSHVPNNPVWDGVSPLMLAVGNSYFETLAGNLAAAKLLLAHGANPNPMNSDGNTALSWAFGSIYSERWVNDPTRLELAKLLLDHHANPNVRDKNGLTPLDRLKLTLASNTASSDQKALAGQLADLLRQHGALDVLPDWDRITVSRPLAKYSAAIFYKGTNDWNRFTLFDLLGVQYDLLTASPGGVGGVTRVPAPTYGANGTVVQNSLTFPDFGRIVIHRPPASGTNWTELKINLSRAFDFGDCTADVPLQFGDVVEIPEADHVINEPWRGLSTNALFTLKNCLTRHLQVTVNGQTTNLTIAPYVEIIMPQSLRYRHTTALSILPLEMQPPQIYLLENEPFMIWPVLENSKLLLASSDLSRVTVKRRDTVTGKTREWTVDCSNPNSPPNFWLRDGDVITVPEKP